MEEKSMELDGDNTPTTTTSSSSSTTTTTLMTETDGSTASLVGPVGGGGTLYFRQQQSLGLGVNVAGSHGHGGMMIINPRSASASSTHSTGSSSGVSSASSGTMNDVKMGDCSNNGESGGGGNCSDSCCTMDNDHTDGSRLVLQPDQGGDSNNNNNNNNNNDASNLNLNLSNNSDTGSLSNEVVMGGSEGDTAGGGSGSGGGSSGSGGFAAVAGRSSDDTTFFLGRGRERSTNSFSGRSSSGSGLFHHQRHRPTRACPSPISSIVGSALNQMHLKRSSSAPMINQLAIGDGSHQHPSSGPESEGEGGAQVASHASTISASSGNVATGSHHKEEIAPDLDASSYASSFLSSLGGGRPRRFSASFSPGSPGPAPNRVSQLRQENTTDWETVSEKDFHGTISIAQSWEDLSLDSMSMEVSSSTRRPSISDQLWLTMPPSSAPSSPAASPRVLSRFSPNLSSPSPTRKSFTTRRSLSPSPIAVRPSVLTIGQGVKRKCDWDSNSNSSNNGNGSQMDCSPQPSKRPTGLLSFNNSVGLGVGSPGQMFSNPNIGIGSGYPFHVANTSTTPIMNPHQFFSSHGHSNASASSSSSSSGPSPFHLNPSNSSSMNNASSNNSLVSMSMMSSQLNTSHHQQPLNHLQVEDSPFSCSNETESSISSIGACDSDSSPFFRPVDSPLAPSLTTSPEDSPRPIPPKM